MVGHIYAEYNTLFLYASNEILFGKLFSSDLVGEGEVAFPDQWGSGRGGGGGRGMGGSQLPTSRTLYSKQSSCPFSAGSCLCVLSPTAKYCTM